MNPTQMPAYPQNFGALVVAASRSILQSNNDFAPQASSTEDTIAEDASDASQNTVDHVPDANTSTSMPQITSFPSSKALSAMPCAIAQNIVSSDLIQHKNGYNSVLQDDCNAKKKDHKKRSKNWSLLETSKLIRARGELDERFRSSGRKAALWEEIAQALQKDDVFRDGHQCKDKWEKLSAGYKEVQECAREKEDLPFYKQIHVIISGRQDRKESIVVDDCVEASKGNRAELGNGHMQPNCSGLRQYVSMHENNTQNENSGFAKKRKREYEGVSFADISVVQELLETILTTQQQLFKDLLDAVEKKVQIREQIRLEREEIWRAEERAQRYTFNHTMMMLTQKLLGERPLGVTPVSAPTTVAPPMVSPTNAFGSLKKRSKNWKRTEVFQLIHIRKEMESKFAKSSRRAGLWEEVATRLALMNIKRDGKQCREKWDKLMAGYKDVIDGRRDKDESPYYKELFSYMEMVKDSKTSAPADPFKEELLPT